MTFSIDINSCTPSPTTDVTTVSCEFLSLCETNNLTAIKHFYDSNTALINVNFCDPKTRKTAGHYAAQNLNVELLQWLHEKGADLVNLRDVGNRTPLNLASNSGGEEEEMRAVLELFINNIYRYVC
jgi:hypothetical protein